jgi:hypothetical protein
MESSSLNGGQTYRTRRGRAWRGPAGPGKAGLGKARHTLRQRHTSRFESSSLKLHGNYNLDIHASI